LPGFLRTLVGLVVFRSGCLPRQTGLGYQPTNMTLTVFNIEFFTKVVPCKWHRPRRRVNPAFFRWIIKRFNELLVLLFCEFA
jgi:hypothetical protein